MLFLLEERVEKVCVNGGTHEYYLINRIIVYTMSVCRSHTQVRLSPTRVTVLDAGRRLQFHAEDKELDLGSVVHSYKETARESEILLNEYKELDHDSVVHCYKEYDRESEILLNED